VTGQVNEGATSPRGREGTVRTHGQNIGSSSSSARHARGRTRIAVDRNGVYL
jgi:hypothetical protein